MPPKPKFTKEEIVAAALELVSQRGMEALTARDLAAALGSSASPIFTVFQNMEQVQQAVKQAALERYSTFVEEAIGYTPAFKQFGMRMIRFANEEPKLFQLLFMTEQEKDRRFEDMFAGLGRTAQTCIDVIQSDYGLTQQDAKLLFQHVWIHTFGIGVMCATRVCHFTENEINEMLGQDFAAAIMLVKSGNLHQPTVRPILKPDYSSNPQTQN